MGHYANSKDNLVPLIDRLNQYPIGLVDNKILREILTLLFDKKEVFVASKFPLEEATLPELEKRTRMKKNELLPILNSMADKGLIMDLPYRGKTYYLLMPGIIGFFEFTFMKHRADLPLEKVARLMTDYFHKDPEQGQFGEFFGSKTPITRSLVNPDVIPVSSEVVSYQTARGIIEHSDFGAAGMCFCRHKKQHIGRKCKKGAPIKSICISLGTGARFLSRRGFAEFKTKKKLLDLIDLAHSLNLTHITDNIRSRPTFICSCCGCCCEILAGVKMGAYDGVAKTSYIATIDPDLCEYCGDCFTGCNVRAIALDTNRRPKKHSDRVSTIKENICLGCGACISSCSKDAISLIPRQNPVIPKEKKRALYRTVLKEKGRLSPYIVNRTVKKIKKSLSLSS